jgi:hypothetical protein
MTAPRRKGSRSAKNLARRLQDGRQLTPEAQALLELTCRLHCHASNISSRLYREGELTAEGEPRAILRVLVALSAEVRANLGRIFDEADASQIDTFFGGGQR